MHKFKAIIEIIGVNPFVQIPDTILEKIFDESKRRSSPIPVKGTINGYPYKQTLVKYAGLWRLYLNTPMRTISKTITGDSVTIEIIYDPIMRKEPVNKELESMLKIHLKAKIAYESLPPSRQKEINRYLNNLKSDVTLKRNVEKVIKHLSGKTVDGVLFR